MINKALRTLYFYNAIFVLAGSLFGPLYAVYIEKIGGNVFIISVSWALFLISSTLFTYVISKFGDTVREKEYLLMAGFLLRGVVWILYIFVGNLWFLMVLQVLLGLGEALGSPSFDSLVAKHLDKGRFVEEYADMKIIFNLSAGLAAIIGGALVAKFGFPTLFIIMAVLALICFFGILFKPRKLL
ncbi:MFS transporter [Candidatus Parcubacteria bacterium]|nr:MFS transporter [Candidatus Parcubacteria bacterium]